MDDIMRDHRHIHNLLTKNMFLRHSLLNTKVLFVRFIFPVMITNQTMIFEKVIMQKKVCVRTFFITYSTVKPFKTNVYSDAHVNTINDQTPVT